MSAGLLAAGVSCSNPTVHAQRLWAIAGDRRLHLIDGGHAAIKPELRHALRLPIPGDGAPLAVDAHVPFVVLADGSAHRLHHLNGALWRPITEADVTKKNGDGPVLIAGGAGGCGMLWVMDVGRRVFQWTAAGGRVPISDVPVPGTQRVLGCDVRTRSVVLEDGTRLAWVGGRWTSMGSVLDAAASGMVRVRVVNAWSRGIPHGDANEGDILTMPEAEARQALALGRIAFASADA